MAKKKKVNAKKKYVGGRVCFETEKGMYENACDAVVFAILGLNLPKTKEQKTIDTIRKACKIRMKKLGFD